MAMPKARGEFVEYDNSDDTVLLRNDTDGSRWYPLVDLNRAELMKAAAGRCPGVGKLTSYPNDTLQVIVRSAEVPPMTLNETPATLPVTEVAAATSVEVSPAPTAPAPQSTTAVAEKMAEALSLFAEQVEAQTTQAVDIDTVRTIVTEQVTEEMASATSTLGELLAAHEAATAAAIAELAPQVTSVVVNDLPAVDIEGTTHHMLPRVIRAAAARLNVLMVGPMGTGKSTIGRQVAEGLALTFYAQSCGPDTMSSALFGYKDAHGNYHRTLFREAYEHGGLFLLDEVDNGHPSILTGLNQALSNGHCAFPDGMVERHPDFVCVATGNTWGSGATAEYVGRNALDAAFLDRFGSRLAIDIDEKMETAIVTGRNPAHADTILKRVRTMRKNVERNGLKVNLSPRASFDTATLMAAGASWDEACDERLLAGVPDDQRRKILDGI